MERENKANDALLSLMLLIPTVLFSAYTTMKLWNWFISDTFNLVQLGVWQAYGVGLVLSYITYKTPAKDDVYKPYSTSLGLIKESVVTAVFLLFGLIAKQFI